MKLSQSLIKALKSHLAEYRHLNTIIDAIAHEGGVALLVGGAVRDLLLGLPIKDLDIEVHELTPQQLEKILRLFGPVSLVGKAFGVYRLHGLDVDWSLPRRDSAGRKPKVTIDPFMGYAQAFRRRDLTINAMGINLTTFELIDPFKGEQDLKKGILRAPDATLFIEDPLRLYRVMQFISRFKMQPDKELNKICSKMDISKVSRERIEAEFEKMLLRSEQPSLGLRWLQEIGRLPEIFPELAATVGVKQNPYYHPEGDVFEHTMQALDASARFDYPERLKKIICRYAAICHDLGKPVTTEVLEGRIISHEHAQKGVPIAKKFLRRITRQGDIIEAVTKLVRYHMEPMQFITGGAKPNAYKRLALKLAPQVSLALLADLSTADKQGRNPRGIVPLTKQIPEIEEFRKQAEKINVLTAAEAPLLLGRDLIDQIPAGKQLGIALKRAYAIQLDEGVHDKQLLKKRVLTEFKKKSA